MFCGNRGAAMVVQSPSYPHQKHGAISVLFTPKAGLNKHFLLKNVHYGAKLCILRKKQSCLRESLLINVRVWWEADKGVMIWFADLRIHNAYIAWLSRWLMDDSWVLKFKAYIIAITLHKHTLKIYRMFGIIALMVLCQQSKMWRQWWTISKIIALM